MRREATTRVRVDGSVEPIEKREGEGFFFLSFFSTHSFLFRFFAAGFSLLSLSSLSFTPPQRNDPLPISCHCCRRAAASPSGRNERSWAKSRRQLSAPLAVSRLSFCTRATRRLLLFSTPRASSHAPCGVRVEQSNHFGSRTRKTDSLSNVNGKNLPTNAAGERRGRPHALLFFFCYKQRRRRWKARALAPGAGEQALASVPLRRHRRGLLEGAAQGKRRSKGGQGEESGEDTTTTRWGAWGRAHSSVGASAAPGVGRERRPRFSHSSQEARERPFAPSNSLDLLT